MKLSAINARSLNLLVNALISGPDLEARGFGGIPPCRPHPPEEAG